jgi:hypothetical protein
VRFYYSYSYHFSVLNCGRFLPVLRREAKQEFYRSKVFVILELFFDFRMEIFYSTLGFGIT